MQVQYAFKISKIDLDCEILVGSRNKLSLEVGIVSTDARVSSLPSCTLNTQYIPYSATDTLFLFIDL